MLVVLYLAETTISTIHKSGLRGSVYDLAGKIGAFHINEEKTSIQYEMSNLLAVRVLFPDIRHCGIFQSQLEGIVKRIFDLNAVVNHTREYRAVNMPTNPVCVLSSDYISTDNPDSIEYSVFSGHSSLDDTNVDLAMQPILWENANLSCFRAGCKGIICHLMSQTLYIQHADNPNNVLIMSAENHVRFDGFSPKIAIRWMEETNRTVTVHDEELTFCNIAIECLNIDVFTCLGAHIKQGTVSLPETMTYVTCVAVPNPMQFRQFLTFKYLETKSLQNSDESDSSRAKMSRAREEAKLRMQQEDYCTIDLNIQQTKKRNIAVLLPDTDI